MFYDECLVKQGVNENKIHQSHNCLSIFMVSENKKYQSHNCLSTFMVSENKEYQSHNCLSAFITNFLIMKHNVLRNAGDGHHSDMIIICHKLPQ